MYRANYGNVLYNLTLKNGDIGLILGNHSEVFMVDISNCSVGIQIENISESWIDFCNISECDTAIKVVNSIHEKYQSISIGFNNVENCTNGLIVNSSSKISIYANYLNCSNIDLKFNDCNINRIKVNNCNSPGNVAPDKPDNISGAILGDPDTKYSYSTVTNDSNDNQIYYKFFWGDGNLTNWLGPYLSNDTITVNHTWSEEGRLYITWM